MAIYGKPVKLLFKDMIEDLAIKKGDILRREHVCTWFKEKYPKVKDGTISAHLLKMSTNAPSRIHYNVNQNGEDDLLYQIDSQKFRLFDAGSDPEPIYRIPDVVDPPPPDPQPEVSEFAYEKDLQNFLAKNLDKIEPGLKLYKEEDISGIEFPVGNRFIDILALDNKNNFVVIELKVSKGYDRVVGQILRYIAWIRKNHADDDQLVRGVIVAREISEDLLLACSEVSDIGLFEYELSVSLVKINKK